MTVCVMGLDLSLSSTGLASISAGGQLEIAEHKSPVARTLSDRWRRAHDLAQRLLIGVERGSTRLVAIEGPSFGSRDGHAHDRSALWWDVIGTLVRREIPVVEVPPATVKKWATNAGNAQKHQVGVAMSRLWPDLDAPERLTDNEWDALALATLAAQHIGWPVPSRAHHQAALAKIAWPELPEAVPA